MTLKEQAEAIAHKLDAVVIKLREDFSRAVEAQKHEEPGTPQWWFWEGKRTTAETALLKIGYTP